MTTNTSNQKQSLKEKGRFATHPDKFETGDKVLWDNRKTPLTVIEPAHVNGEHSDPQEIAFEGPQGGIVTAYYKTYGNYWQTDSDGRVDTIVITEDSDERPITLSDEDPFTTSWETPADPCPHCNNDEHDEHYSRDRFRCKYLKTDFYTGSDRGSKGYHQYQDGDGLPRKLLRAVCTDCGGVVYEHPAYKPITEIDTKEL
jgi:hypothetical protein